MKLLLTSQSIYNRTIETALRELLPKPSAECIAVYITTSQNAAVGDKSWLIQNLNSAFNLGWKSFEIIDIAAMIDLPKKMWWDRIQQADVLFMGGGSNGYLGYWLEQSGLDKALPEILQHKVYAGSSAGSIVATSSLNGSSKALKQMAGGQDINLDVLGPEGQSSPRTLGLVDVEIRPHYQAPEYPFITDELLQTLADQTRHELYAIDDNSALKINEGHIEVVTEGHWKHFSPAA